MNSQVTSKGCSKSFILCVCYRALYHSSVQFARGSEITFPFDESDVLEWLHCAKLDSLDQGLQELLGGTIMNHADPTTYWTKAEQFQTWWKNNMERKTKTLSLQNDSQYVGDNENRIKRARYCRGAIAICTNIKNYFERKIIQHGGFVVNVEITLKMPSHMPVPIAPPSCKVRPRLTLPSCKHEIKDNVENISFTTQTTPEDSILLKRKFEQITCEAEPNYGLISRLDTSIYRSLFPQYKRIPYSSPANEIASICSWPSLSDESCSRYKHIAADSCGESSRYNSLVDTQYHDAEEHNFSHERLSATTTSTICDVHNTTIFGYDHDDSTQNDDYEGCCLFFDNSVVDGTTTTTTSSARSDSVPSYKCDGFSRDSINTISNLELNNHGIDIMSDEHRYAIMFDNNKIESTSFAYTDWLTYKDLRSMYRPAAITATNTNITETKQTTLLVNNTSFDDLSKLIYYADYVQTCESDDVDVNEDDDINEMLSTLKEPSTMMAKDLLDFYDDAEDNEVGFSALDM